MLPHFKVYKNHPDAVLPEFKNEGDVGADLCLVEDISIWPGQLVLARTGLIIEPPEGYHLEIYIRSSVAVNNPGLILANSIGLIDEKYCGPNDELKVALLNSSPSKPWTIENLPSKFFNFKKGDRIAQLVIKKTRRGEFVWAEWNDNQSRGGFGSTGK